MGDEAFARRFYADRTELQGLGVPIASVRDEFTGGGALQPARGAVLPAAGRPDRRRARRAADQPLPARGPVRLRRAAAPGAAEPGPGPRAGPRPTPGPRRPPSSCSARSYTAEVAQRLAKLEQAISKQRTVRFRYWTITHRLRGRAHREPVRPVRAERRLVRGRRRPRPRAEEPDRRRTFRVSRIRGEIKFATRRERDFRMPADFNVTAYRDRAPWRLVADEARRRPPSPSRPTPRWLVERRFGALRRVRGAGRRVGRVHDRRTPTSARALRMDPVARRPGACPSSRPSWSTPSPPTCRPSPTCTAARRPHARHAAAPARPAEPVLPAARAQRRSRPSGSRCCRPCSPSCSPAAARSSTARVATAEIESASS